MKSVTIILPLPRRELSPNARCHWAKKSKITKSHRIEAWSVCNKFAIQQLKQNPKWRRAKMQVKAYFKTRRHPDPGNFMASLKAYEDGIADAGVVENDRGLWPERPEFFTDAKNPRVELTITEEA